MSGRVFARRSFLGGVGATAAVTSLSPRLLTSGGVIPVQLVNITDLHGYLQPEGVSPIYGADGKLVEVGGAAYLATRIKQLRSGQENSILFSTGDNFTGWERDGFWFRGEPVVEFLNYIGLEFSTCGNHEFDQRPEQLVDHMIRGHSGGIFGEAGVDVAFVNSQGRRYSGTKFAYSSANIVSTGNGSPVLPPYVIKSVRSAHGGSARIGFINLTVPDTVNNLRTILSFNPSVRALDEIETANKYAKILKDKGVNAIVLNMHDGGIPEVGNYYDACAGDLTSSPETGNAFDVARKVSPDIDIIFTGHQHHLFNCTIPDPLGRPRIVLEAGCYGQAVADVHLYLDTHTGKVIREETVAHNVANTHDVEPDAEAARIADYWTEAMADRDASELAQITADITGAPNCCGESTLGNAVADMELHQGRREQRNPSRLALVKQKYLPPDLTYAPSTSEKPGSVLFAEATGNPYGKSVPLVNADLTGAQIIQILEEQWAASDSGEEIFSPLAVSNNFRYSYDSSKPRGQRVDAASVQLDGKRLQAAKVYRVTGIITFFYGHTYADDPEYPTAKKATNYFRLYDEDRFAWVDWLRDHGVVSPPPLGRITDTGADMAISPASKSS